MVSAPMNMVSSVPRAPSRRSVNTWPRSGSAHIWTSSMPRKDTRFSIGMDSTVHRKYRARAGTIFSSPVIRATCPLPLILTARS